MPSLTIGELIEIISKSDRRYASFIESGTYLGDTILSLERYFDNLYTVELNQDLYNQVKTKSNKIKFFQGESHVIFERILPEINDNAIFWLDGHFSQGITSRGIKDVPLLEELEVINRCFNRDAIIIVDDARYFGTYIDEDWTDITEKNILNILKDRMTDYFYRPSSLNSRDRLVIFIKNK